MLAKYMAATALPAIDSSMDWTQKISEWLVFGNDSVGDCAEAAALHFLMLWTANAGTEFVPRDPQDGIAAYTAITGYNPEQPSTDQGTDLLSLLNFWRSTGILGHKIYAYAEVDPSSGAHVRAAVQLFGGLYIGVQLPQSAMDATQNGQAWTNITDTNIIGGHCILVVAYCQNGLTCVTWGQKQQMTWDWFNKYCDEAFVVLSPDFVGLNGLAPDGFNLSQLAVDLQLIG